MFLTPFSTIPLQEHHRAQLQSGLRHGQAHPRLPALLNWDWVCPRLQREFSGAPTPNLHAIGRSEYFVNKGDSYHCVRRTIWMIFPCSPYRVPPTRPVSPGMKVKGRCTFLLSISHPYPHFLNPLCFHRTAPTGFEDHWPLFNSISGSRAESVSFLGCWRQCCSDPSPDPKVEPQLILFWNLKKKKSMPASILQLQSCEASKFPACLFLLG